jgi:alkylhydroperoxidase family enzyme
MGVTPRIEPLPPEEWSDLLRAVLEGMPGGLERPMNIFTTMARHPDLFDKWVRFGGQLLMGGTIPARERELVILRTATNCNCEYEWAQHVPLGLQAGLTEEEIEAVGLPIGDRDWSDSDALLLRAVDELDASCNLSDDTWNALSKRHDERQMIEFPMLVGHYKMVAGALNSLRVQLESAGR